MKASIDTCAKVAMRFMAVQRVTQHGVTHPFGDERSVHQAFPAAIPKEEADPFLMCDYFDAIESSGKAAGEDDFPVGWHPHRGFDICSYLRSGTGRHADSLGNRETYETPGMQWMSTGSGVEHAEGGGNYKGQRTQGFQIWINVPADKKMDDPRYGTAPTNKLPLIQVGAGVKARVLAGEAWDVIGPFETTQSVQMIDLELESAATAAMEITNGLDTAMVYVYEGSLARLNSQETIPTGSVVLLDASSDDVRGLELVASAVEGGAKVLLFAGKKLKEPVAWHGPIVMNTQQQIQTTFKELRSGKFPPKRVDWDYKRHASQPKA
jgi:redox-sensitive bicupin YhaK (pirin superfamily)